MERTTRRYLKRIIYGIRFLGEKKDVTVLRTKQCRIREI
jgi:hypothetical protein